MKTLVIANFPEEKELSNFKEKFADELGRSDVIFIENPKDKTDLEGRLKSYRREFDRVVVSAHGNKGENPTMTVGEDKVAITDVIKAVNKDNEETLKKIHLTSCFIGSNFEKIEQKDGSSRYYLELDESLRDGQILFLHGDSYTGDLRSSLDQRLEEIVKSQDYSVSEAVFDSAEAMSVVVKNKKHHNPRDPDSLETFSYQPFGREDEEFSTTILRPYLNDVVTKARNFEKAQGILNGDVSEQRLENLSEEDLQQYLSERFIRKIVKAFDANHLEMVESLIKKTNPNLANKDGFTALMYAANKGDAEMVEYLIEKGADPEIKTPLGVAASYLAKGENKDKIIELLSQAIEKKHQDAILKKWESAFSSQELEEMRGKSSNSVPDSLGQKTEETDSKIDFKAIWDGNEKVFDVEKIQQIDSVNFGLKEGAQDSSTRNPRLRGGEVATPSTTIENGTAMLFLVVGAAIAKFVTGKFKPTKTPKPKNGKKVEEENFDKEL